MRGPPTPRIDEVIPKVVAVLVRHTLNGAVGYAREPPTVFLILSTYALILLTYALISEIFGRIRHSYRPVEIWRLRMIIENTLNSSLKPAHSAIDLAQAIRSRKPQTYFLYLGAIVVSCASVLQAQDATTLAVTAASTSAVSFTLTATVSDTPNPATKPTGNVKFTLGAVDLATCTLSSGSCNQAVNSSSISAGANKITASYTPTGNFLGSNGSIAVEAPKITFTPSPLNIPSGSTAPISFTIAITGSSGPPTGTISLTATTGKVANATPTCTTTNNTVTCTDTYTPDASMTGSSTFSQVIAANIAASGSYLAASQSLDITIGTATCAGCFATLGLGVSINYKHYSDYNDVTNILQSTNLGNASPQLLVGISYQTPWHGILYNKIGCKPSLYNQDVDGKLVYCYPWRAFINAKFSATASQTVNGFTVGTSYRIAKSLDLLMGISLNPFNEATPGFRAAAIQVTQAQQNAGNPNYAPFDLYKMQHNLRNAFDGFPTQLLQYSCTSTTPPTCTTTTGPLIYAGSPTGVQYLPGLFFGVVVPIQLKTLLGSK